ncbi:hypothetical protein [Paracoccus aestuariivivens]|uniref:Uncharacterized protein n=1 Tax=Paracoccus aestuariivivens TaxID=1820333 RepID=A0A6L6J5V5_9RHOB|nr:hypothetical protein [Paracoccus aestuariivivens]MTH76109.1 hypothetical protein [Paracoccus aestuariivivens]
MSIIDCLRKAQGAIINLDPILAYDLITESKEMRATVDLDASNINNIALEVERIGLLSLAVMSGISSAIDMIKVLSESAGTCTLYDRDGRRESHRISDSTSRKF